MYDTRERVDALARDEQVGAGERQRVAGLAVERHQVSAEPGAGRGRRFFIRVSPALFTLPAAWTLTTLPLQRALPKCQRSAKRMERVMC